MQCGPEVPHLPQPQPEPDVLRRFMSHALLLILPLPLHFYAQHVEMRRARKEQHMRVSEGWERHRQDPCAFVSPVRDMQEAVCDMLPDHKGIVRRLQTSWTC